MNKKFILGLALAVVLVSGAFYGAQADCGCLPHISMPSCFSCAQQSRDFDRPDATCQGAFKYGPTVPEYMGSAGG